MIENIQISSVNAKSDNGIIVVGKDNNIRNIEIKDFNLTLTKGENRAMRGCDIDLRPNTYIKRQTDMQYRKYIVSADVKLVNFSG